MTPFLIILAAIALTTFTAWLSYCQRDNPATLWLMPVASGSLGICWIFLARWLDHTRWILVSSVAWDVMCVAVFALFPVAFLAERTNHLFWLGLSLSVLGLVLMQRS